MMAEEDYEEPERRGVPQKRYERMHDGFVVEIPEEDDFDLLNEFEKRRYLRLKEKEQRLHHAGEKERKQRRDKLRNEILNDGHGVVKHMTHQFLQIKHILCPFEIKRKCVNDLVSVFQKLRSSSYSATHDYDLLFGLPVAVRVLRIIKPLPQFQKSRAIRNRMLIMEQIRRRGKEQVAWSTDDADMDGGLGSARGEGDDDDEATTTTDEHPPLAAIPPLGNILPVKALRVMELSLRRSVPIPLARANLWRVKRDQTRRARAKLDMILTRLEACRLMGLCRSPFHHRASGCPACRVIHMGPVNDVQQYVRSAHVDTGAETLIKLEYEVEGLRVALARQQALLTAIADDLRAFESDLLAQVAVAVQRWYCCYRSRKRCAEGERALVKSQYYYRIRRLSRLKRELDRVDPFTVDKRPLLYRYEMVEGGEGWGGVGWGGVGVGWGGVGWPGVAAARHSSLTRNALCLPGIIAYCMPMYLI